MFFLTSVNWTRVSSTRVDFGQLDTRVELTVCRVYQSQLDTRVNSTRGQLDTCVELTMCRVDSKPKKQRVGYCFPSLISRVYQVHTACRMHTKYNIFARIDYFLASLK